MASRESRGVEIYGAMGDGRMASRGSGAAGQRGGRGRDL